MVVDRWHARASRARDRLPGAGRLAQWYRRRPFLTLWGLLATGMALVVVVFGRDAGLTLGQHTFLTVMAIPLAGLCAWIVWLEDGHNGGPA